MGVLPEWLGSRPTGQGMATRHLPSYDDLVRLILASQSPRRAELLAAAGFEFDVQAAEIDERRLPGEDPRTFVTRVAADKAAAVARLSPGRVVVGADTAVVIDDHVLGKPADDREAAEMLRLLSGRTHDVLTGIAVRQGDRELAEAARTRVRFLPLSAKEIAWYVATGEPRDKAGAYAIQGLASRFVDWIEGSYSNVMGLPVASLYRLLQALGVGGP